MHDSIPTCPRVSRTLIVTVATCIAVRHAERKHGAAEAGSERGDGVGEEHHGQGRGGQHTGRRSARHIIHWLY